LLEPQKHIQGEQKIGFTREYEFSHFAKG